MYKLLEIMRPKQWIKSGFVFTPLLFSLQFDNIIKLQATIIATISFIMVSSAIYIFNDIMDLDKDKKHPIKKKRPLAAGKISLKKAQILLLILLFLGYATAMSLPISCYFIIIIYMIMNMAYSTKLKNMAIIDVIIIATGFVLRVLMGGYAAEVTISPWLTLSTFLLALFLGFGKRRHELGLNLSNQTRESLTGYNEQLLDKFINVSCATTLVCYVIYTADAAQKTGRGVLVYTVIFVVFGLFRYLQNIYLDKEGGEPERMLYKDKIFLLNILLWLVVTLGILSY